MHTEYLAKNLHEITDKIAQHGIAIIDQFLPAHTVQALAQEISQLGQLNTLKAAGIGRANVAINPTLRGDQIYWLEEQPTSPAQQDYFNAMEALRLQLNQQLYLGLFGLESHLAVYPPGMVYQKHLDRFKGENLGKPLRKISAIVYLNKDWRESDGGQLRIYLNDHSAGHDQSYIDLVPIGGRAVFFLSDTFYHEVLPAQQNRMSLTGWFLTR
jgi:SM-20-related protein